MVIATSESASATWNLNNHMVRDLAGSQLGSCCSPGHGTAWGWPGARLLQGARSGGAGMDFHPSPAQFLHCLTVLRAAK